MHKFSLIQGGGKCDNCSVKGGEDYSNTSSVCSSTKNSVVHVNLLMLGGPGGMLPQVNLISQFLRPFLVASETQFSEKSISDIHWFPYLLIGWGVMFSHA